MLGVGRQCCQALILEWGAQASGYGGTEHSVHCHVWLQNSAQCEQSHAHQLAFSTTLPVGLTVQVPLGLGHFLT